MCDSPLRIKAEGELREAPAILSDRHWTREKVRPLAVSINEIRLT